MEAFAGLLSWLFTAGVGTASVIEIVFTLAAGASLVLNVPQMRISSHDQATDPDKRIRWYARADVRHRWKTIGIYGAALLIGINALRTPHTPVAPSAALWGVGFTMGLLIFLAGDVQDARDRAAIAREKPSP